MAQTVYDAVIGAWTMRQVTRGSFEANPNVIAGVSSGAADPSELYGGEIEPKCTWESADVDGFVNNLSAQSGLAITSGTITLPFRKAADAGSHSTGSVHAAISGTDGLAIPISVSANQGDEAATCSTELWFRSTDGSTDPVSTSTSNSLSSQSFNAQFALGAISVDSTEVTEPTGVTINYGIEVEVSRYKGLPFPVRIKIKRRRPTINLNFENIDDAMSFSMSYGSMTTCAVFLRKYSDGGTFVSNGTSSHLKFSFGTGIESVQTVEASGEDHAVASVRLHGKSLTHARNKSISV